MTSLRPYFLYFFILSLTISCVIGLLAFLLPVGKSGFLTAFPYLIAMIAVLFRFLKKEKRAPSVSEKHKLTLGFIAIFLTYSAIGCLLGLAWALNTNSEIFDDIWHYLTHPRVFFYSFGLFLLLALPLYLTTIWLYGKRAQHLVERMYEDHEIDD
ncbi:ABZJ_00895 family protein [Acinetobacter sp. MD2(2019)]|uniref:ABZJ_00895 family protein n=1 Tax=Acinetobacter sp. MD2(2019) TaxID=2605273 RepID=UPI002D1F29B4|nr:ABZJ_00895 family protein [Acinetobacter sp. MD2(2019)]MEB3754719.1 hypothetical protein [Acinetobacter sp. MD2(2019)]